MSASPGQDVVLRDDIDHPVQRVVAAVRDPRFLEQLEAALPENVSVERFTRVTVTAMRENGDELAKCDPNTILAAVIRCAQDGLMPDGQEAALVRFKDKATYMPMIGGYRKIAAEYGWSLRTDAVYENDEFQHELGEHPNIVHVPARLGTERGDLIGAYALARNKDGRVEFEVMDKAAIEKVRATSRAKDNGPWRDWYDRMAEKTVGRRLFKKLPLGELVETEQARIRRIVAADDPADAAEAVYGGEARAALETSTAPRPSEPSPPPRTTPPRGDGGEGEQETPAGAAAPASPSPEPFAGEEPEEPEAAVVDHGLEEAGKVKLTAGRYEGQTIAEIHELGEVGRKYLAWVEKSWAEDDVKSAAITWNAHHKEV